MSNLYHYRCTVRRTIDGDTIDVDIDLGFSVILKNQRIRLANIDTPEVRTRDEREKKFGLMAKQFVATYCYEGAEVIIETDISEQDKFGRILGTVWCSGLIESLNEVLLDMNLAVEYNGKSKTEIREEHEKNWEILDAENGVQNPE